MLSFSRILLWTASAAVCLFSAPASSSMVPGIIDSSIPKFENSVSIRANRGNWTVMGHGDFSFEDATQLWSGASSSFRLTARFDNSGNFVTGSVSITGRVPGLVEGRQLLMTADLISFGWDGQKAIGFNTDSIVCNSMLGVSCTTKESVIILLDSVFGGDVNARFRQTGVAITSVPLPAAVLLFGAGLVMLIGRARQ